MGPNFLITEELALLAVIDPDLYDEDTYISGYVPMKDWAIVAALIAVGDIVTDGTVNAKLIQATDSLGTNAKDIAGKAIAELTEAGTDSNKQAWIHCRPEDLDLGNGFTHVALSITTTTEDEEEPAAADLAAFIFGKNGRYGAGGDVDVASVDEIVA